MRRLLVVNADDLGLHEDINCGIRLAHTEGIVTSASVVACGGAFSDASTIIESCPELEIGVHLTLVEEQPLSAPDDIPTLVGSDGRFLSSYRELTTRVLLGHVSPAEVYRELRAQIERVITIGRRPSHLDGHQHVHLLPPLWRVTRKLAHEYNIRWIRLPHFPSLLASRRSALDPFFRFGFNALVSATAKLSNRTEPIARTPGLHLSGRLNEADLLRVISNLRPGISELVTHPGVTTAALRTRYRWNYDWSAELSALTSRRVISVLHSTGVKLARFSEC